MTPPIRTPRPKIGVHRERERAWFGHPHVQWVADLRATIDVPDHDQGN